MSKARRDQAEIDMTPMIDVVFQLIIFFIVTIQMEKEMNPDIKLPDAPDAPEITSGQPSTTLVVEVDRHGWISIHNAKMSGNQLLGVIQGRFNRYGEFPVLIRGDGRTKHNDIRKVMDICTRVGLWRINFAGIKEPLT